MPEAANREKRASAAMGRYLQGSRTLQGGPSRLYQAGLPMAQSVIFFNRRPEPLRLCRARLTSARRNASGAAARMLRISPGRSSKLQLQWQASDPVRSALGGTDR